MYKPFFALLCLLFVATAFRSPAGDPKPKNNTFHADKLMKSRLDATLKRFVDSGQVAGISALIFQKNKEVYYNAVGFSNREAKVPMDRNTLVRIYSMTKPVTGTALMQLFEQGAFQLDDPLAKYLPEFANMQVYKGVDGNGNLILEPARRAITIRDITRHTAGFAVDQNLPGLGQLLKDADAMNPANSLAEAMKKLAGLPLQFHPGEQWAYGPSVDVQAYLVERLSGQPFDQYLQEKIFRPLGMSNTRYVVPAGERQKLAVMYRMEGGSSLMPIPDTEESFNLKNWPLKPGGFGLTSTLDDYMKFASMLVHNGKLGKVKILKPETVKLMATNHLEESVTERMWLPSKGQVGFGIDFAVRLREPASAGENQGVVGEFFWDGAASTLFWVDPVNKLTAVLFVQKFPFYNDLHKQFRSAVYGAYQPH